MNETEMRYTTIGAIGLITIICCCLGYGVYRLDRWINWELSYEDMVRQTVRAMVREDALK